MSEPSIYISEDQPFVALLYTFSSGTKRSDIVHDLQIHLQVGHPILIHVCMCDHDSGGVRACLYRIGMMFIIHSNHWSIWPRSISNHAATLLDSTNYIIKKTRMYTATVTISIWFHMIWVACPVNVFWPLAGTHVVSDVFECAIRH